MSGIVGSRLNNRGSGLVGSLGTDGQVFTSAGAGKSAVFEAGAIDDNAVTLAKMAGLARGTLIYGDTSGDPAALAVGAADEVLTHDGTDFDWAAVAAGGITNAREWKLTSNTTGDHDPLDGFSTCSDTMAGSIGTDMSYSSGEFSFPSTGIWMVSPFFKWYAQSYEGYWYVQVKISTDGGSTWGGGVAGNVYMWEMSSTKTNGVMTYPPFLLDITNTSNNQMRINIQNSNDDIIIEGSAGEKTTYIQFIRLGDT